MRTTYEKVNSKSSTLEPTVTYSSNQTSTVYKILRSLKAPTPPTIRC